VTHALLPQLSAHLHIWECAAGSGQMVRVLADASHVVEATDIETGRNFFATPFIVQAMHHFLAGCS
jgi:hypothetical protein